MFAVGSVWRLSVRWNAASWTSLCTNARLAEARQLGAWPEVLRWVASQRHPVNFNGDPVPLVMFDQGCLAITMSCLRPCDVDVGRQAMLTNGVTWRRVSFTEGAQ